MANRLFIKTYGCQMNVYDSGRMADAMAPLGYRPVDSPGEADMVVLNTCHIREKAAEKVFSELGRLGRIKRTRRAAGSDLIIAVAGCVAQAEGVEILRRAPHVDIVVGPQTYHRLPELVARIARDGRRGRAVLDTEFPSESKFDLLPEETASQGVTAFLSVQEGCNRFCTFCVVPYTRGAEFSRPVAQIEAEARRLVASGAREITLLGQNVNAYHGEPPYAASRGGSGEWGLGRLIRHLAETVDVDRLRYTTSHPRDMDDDLIAAHGEVPALMPFLHLPVQSGSDRVLAAMNRQHTVADYRRTVDGLRRLRPDIALSSDFIVGYPGETEPDFDASLALVAEIGFAQAYSFKYSPRPGTPAASLPDQIGQSLKAERLERLQELLRRQQSAFNRACVGRVLPVLFERRGRHSGQLVGRSPYLQAVHAEAPEGLIGRIAGVVVDSAQPNSLSGRLAAPEVAQRPGEAVAAGPARGSADRSRIEA